MALHNLLPITVVVTCMDTRWFCLWKWTGFFRHRYWRLIFIRFCVCIIKWNSFL